MKYTITLIVIFYFAFALKAQVLTANDGFEGPPLSANPPTGWHNCNDGVSTVDTQPGFFQNHKAPAQDQSYISMVTRSVGSNAGTAESIFANLNSPFEKGVCYSFEIDLTLSETFGASLGFDDYQFNNPCILQVFGFNTDCANPSEIELLYESEVVNHFNWKTYKIEFIPQNHTYTHIKLRPFFYPVDNIQNSALLADNIKVPLNNELINNVNGLLHIIETATQIQWYFNGEIVSGANSIEMPIVGTGLYSVTFKTEDGCFKKAEIEHQIDFNPVQYSPNPTSSLLNIQFLVPVDGLAEFYVYNELGQIVKYHKQYAQIGKNESSLDLSMFAPGVYVVSLVRIGLNINSFKVVRQ